MKKLFLRKTVHAPLFIFNFNVIYGERSVSSERFTVHLPGFLTSPDIG